MRTFFLVVKSIIFLVVFLFSLNNTHVTTINIFPGVADIAVDAPLIIWLLLFFLLGIVITVIFFLRTVLKNAKSKKSDVS
jgi:uncharacterized integral membrane protein